LCDCYFQDFATISSDDWARLNEDKQEMLSSAPTEEQHDFVVDDSLFEGDDDMDVDAEAAQTGILEAYLVDVLGRIKAQVLKYGQLLCYSQGTFWIRPRDPFFALHASSSREAGLSPTELYHLDTFVWVPDRLPGVPNLKCICGNKLTRNGWNENPIARRVKCLHRDYFLLTNRMRCEKSKGKGCGKNFQGTDPHILVQLPRHHQEAFPALLTARAAIDKDLMALMRTCFATRFGPEPFAALLSEMRHLDHAHRELMYLAAMTASPLYAVQPEPFSEFGDRQRYAGTVPSKHYCKAVFVDWMHAHRPFFDRVMASLPAGVLKGDHTFGVSTVCICTYI
jgi:hypothetical protein